MLRISKTKLKIFFNKKATGCLYWIEEFLLIEMLIHKCLLPFERLTKLKLPFPFSPLLA